MIEIMRDAKRVDGAPVDRTRSRWFVCPTPALRDLIYRNRERLVAGCNYCCEWKDVNGFGIHLAVSEWGAVGSMYNCPPSKRHLNNAWREANIRARIALTVAKRRKAVTA